jgi:hypothetical protein
VTSAVSTVPPLTTRRAPFASVITSAIPAVGAMPEPSAHSAAACDSPSTPTAPLASLAANEKPSAGSAGERRA